MMVDKDNSIVKKEKENSKILMSRTTSCEDLSKILDPLYIAIEDKLITIQPEGYIYSLSDVPGCIIGIEPNDEDIYRLGTVFLRNLYVGLDYETNIISMAISEFKSHASFSQYQAPEVKPDNKDDADATANDLINNQNYAAPPQQSDMFFALK